MPQKLILGPPLHNIYVLDFKNQHFLGLNYFYIDNTATLYREDNHLHIEININNDMKVI